MSRASENILAAADRLEEAGRELRQRPAARNLSGLAALLDAWSQKGGPWQRELAAELPKQTGFTEATIREGLSLGLADWNGEALHRLVRRELGSAERLDEAGDPMVSGFPYTACILAGSIPMPTLQTLLLPLVLRSPVLAKTSSRDRLTARLVAASLSEIDPLLGRCIEIVDSSSDDVEATRALLEAPCIVAMGSDTSLENLSRYKQAHQRFVGYGHRLSLAVVGQELLRGPAQSEWADRLARDTALWDQSGCLSPAAVYCVGSADDAMAIAETLAGALARAQARWPRGDLPTAEAAAIAHERDEAHMRTASGEEVAVLASPGTEWTVVREAEATWRPTPLMRFLRVYPVSDAASFFAALTPLSRWLATVAIDGFGAQTAPMQRALANAGVTRIVPAGRMQAPRFDWYHDGSPLLTPLTRFCDRE